VGEFDEEPNTVQGLCHDLLKKLTLLMVNTAMISLNSLT